MKVFLLLGLAMWALPVSAEPSAPAAPAQPVEPAPPAPPDMDEGRPGGTPPTASDDPAFDKYVDAALIAQAWRDLDPALLTDVALQLAEGERVLLRSHKQISAAKVLGLALKVAAEKRDKETLDRLAHAAEKSDNKAFAGQVAAARRLAGESRAVDPALAVSAADTKPESFAVLHNLVKAVETARIKGDAAALAEAQKEAAAAPELTAAQREALAKMAAEAKAALPTGPEKGVASALDKLSGASRGVTYFKEFTGNGGTPFWMESDANGTVINGDWIYVKDRADGGPGWVSVCSFYGLRVIYGRNNLRIHTGWKQLTDNSTWVYVYPDNPDTVYNNTTKKQMGLKDIVQPGLARNIVGVYFPQPAQRRVLANGTYALRPWDLLVWLGILTKGGGNILTKGGGGIYPLESKAVFSPTAESSTYFSRATRF